MNTFSTSAGEICVNVLTYSNASIFVWVGIPGDVRFDDFHASAPSEYSEIPPVSTRLGETDSPGRALSLKLAKRFRSPVMISWCVPDEFMSASAEIEDRILSIVGRTSRQAALVGA